MTKSLIERERERQCHLIRKKDKETMFKDNKEEQMIRTSHSNIKVNNVVTKRHHAINRITPIACN